MKAAANNNVNLIKRIISIIKNRKPVLIFYNASRIKAMKIHRPFHVLFAVSRGPIQLNNVKSGCDERITVKQRKVLQSYFGEQRPDG